MICVVLRLYICDYIRTELCRFSGAKIYPGRGIRFVRADSQVFLITYNEFRFCITARWLVLIMCVCCFVNCQVFLFVNSKCKRYFHNKLKPSKLTWTAMYRKQHKKVSFSFFLCSGLFI